MSKINDDGGPAFPTEEVEEMGVTVQFRSSGMSLRDWFAGQALAGSSSITGWSTAEHVAKASYALADAMLAERDRQP